MIGWDNGKVHTYILITMESTKPTLPPLATTAEREEEAIAAMNALIAAHATSDTTYITFTDPATGKAIMRVPKNAMQMSVFIKSILDESDEGGEDEDEEIPIQVPSVHALAHAVRYCVYSHFVRTMTPLPEEPVKSGDIYKILTPEDAWFGDFIVDLCSKYDEKYNHVLTEVITIADCLNIDPLIKLGCCHIVTLLHPNHNTTEEINARFGLEKDAKRVDDETLKIAHPWMFEILDELETKEKLK